MDPKFQSYIDGYNKVNQFCRDCGMELKVLQPGHVQYALTIVDKHLSSPGIAHGGIVAAVMDATLGTAALTHAFTCEMVCSTVEFKINYLRPAKLGDHLVGEAKIDYVGKRIVVSSGAISRKSDGEMVAKGLGTFNLYPLDKKSDLQQILADAGN